MEKKTNTIIAPPPQIGSFLIYLFIFCVRFISSETTCREKMKTGRKKSYLSCIRIIYWLFISCESARKLGVHSAYIPICFRFSFLLSSHPSVLFCCCFLRWFKNHVLGKTKRNVGIVVILDKLYFLLRI